MIFKSSIPAWSRYINLINQTILSLHDSNSEKLLAIGSAKIDWQTLSKESFSSLISSNLKPFFPKEKKPLHKVQMTDGKRQIIQQLLQEYDIETAEDIQDKRKEKL